jgi:hypothetical protein
MDCVNRRKLILLVTFAGRRDTDPGRNFVNAAKLLMSMTFAAVAPPGPVFSQVLILLDFKSINSVSAHSARVADEFS